MFTFGFHVFISLYFTFRHTFQCNIHRSDENGLFRLRSFCHSRTITSNLQASRDMDFSVDIDPLQKCEEN